MCLVCQTAATRDLETKLAVEKERANKVRGASFTVVLVQTVGSLVFFSTCFY